MTISTWLILCAIWGQELYLQETHKPPEWIRRALQVNHPNSKAKVYRILDDRQVTYLGNGEIRIRQRVVQRIAKESGRLEGGTFAFQNVEGVSQLNDVNGWHFHPNGSAERLKKSQQATFGSDEDHAIHRDSTRVATFERTAKGSVVAFESTATHRFFLGPVVLIDMLNSFPTLKFQVTCEVPLDSQPPISHRLLPFRFSGWHLRGFDSRKKSIDFSNLPPKTVAGGVPTTRGSFPMLMVFFDDPEYDRFGAWDHLARWYYRAFTEAALGTRQPNRTLAQDEKQVRLLFQEVTRRLTYRQVYLAPTRGWIPLQGDEVFDRAYGDCKDMVSCLTSKAAKAGIEVLPVLTSVADGIPLTEADPPNPCFNHVIAAIPMERPANLPAETAIGDQTYLLCDPTARSTPFGFLPAEMRNRGAMICHSEGATWVSISENQSERQKALIHVAGRLDDRLFFTGTWRIEEYGNRLGLRAMLQMGNTRHLVHYLKEALGIPGFATLELTDQPNVVEAKVGLLLRVTWPNFLMPDADGFRLPRQIIYPCPSALKNTTKCTTWPLELPSQPEIRWLLELNADKPVKATTKKLSWQNPYQRFSWHVSEKDDSLKIDYLFSMRPARFTGETVAQAFRHWTEFRDAYERFFLHSSLLHRER